MFQILSFWKGNENKYKEMRDGIKILIIKILIICDVAFLLFSLRN